MQKTILIYLVTYLLLAYLFNYIEFDYSYAELKEYLGILITISGMVFTLMGIWIAFLYPNALLKLIDDDNLENADFSEAKRDTKRLENIVGTVLKSALVVLSISIVYLSGILFSNFDFVKDNIGLVKAFLIAYVLLLSYIQFTAVFSVIASNIMFINDLHSKKEQVEADSDI